MSKDEIRNIFPPDPLTRDFIDFVRAVGSGTTATSTAYSYNGINWTSGTCTNFTIWYTVYIYLYDIVYKKYRVLLVRHNYNKNFILHIFL